MFIRCKQHLSKIANKFYFRKNLLSIHFVGGFLANAASKRALETRNYSSNNLLALKQKFMVDNSHTAKQTTR